MSQKHTKLADTVCKTCKMVVHSHIPHECDPSICKACNGDAIVWGKGEWTGCPDCYGTGKIERTSD